MKIKNINVKNFRGISNVSMSLESAASVIVGPNATGKTTILQSIRLFKALLAPSYFGEGQEVLQTFGGFSPHTRTIEASALLGTIDRPLEIAVDIALSPNELEIAQQGVSQLALMTLESSLGRANGEGGELQLVQFFSTPQGQQQLQDVARQLAPEIKRLAEKPSHRVTLTIDPRQGMIRGDNSLVQSILTLISRTQSPVFGLVSFFPADRSMPSGEVNFQIGAADAQQQIQSHLGNPTLKYARLKQHIVNKTLTSSEDRQALSDDFELIFSHLLPGKTLDGVVLLANGNLAVRIKEQATGSVYDIDNLSSGEKGLLLTFLLARQRMRTGGILLIDEPELHLNPAVCRRILPFLVEKILEPGDLQAIVCTHSPEILAAAYERADCTLYHLVSGADLSPIYERDKGAVFEALKRLGTQTADVLFSKGGLFVEGPHDIEILQAGFSSQISGLEIIPLGGRGDIEREIKSLQDAERKTGLDNLQCFIFDRDRKVVSVKNSPKVRIAQWDRYCLENYLLDADAIYDALQGTKAATQVTRGGLESELRELALKQLPLLIATEAYKKVEPENPGIRPRELRELKDYGGIASHLSARLGRIKEGLANFDAAVWVKEFERECVQLASAANEEWERNWKRECDGKRVLESLHQSLGLNMSLLEFKKKIALEMRQRKTENWSLVYGVLTQLLGGTVV